MALKQIKLAGDPPASALRPVRYSYEWENTWKYVVVRPSTKSVGFAIKTFSNKRGLQVHPGVRRLMAITGHSKSTVIESIAEMRWLGFLWRMYSGQGADSGKADLYQLCLPKTLEHVPLVDAKTAREPAFDELSFVAQKSAVTLEVATRLMKVGGCLSEPGGGLSEPPLVVSANQWWLPQLTTTTHSTNTSNKASHHHSDSAESAARASSRGREYDFSVEDDVWDFVFDAFDEDLDPVEASTLGAMLEKGLHPHEIVNTIKKLRRLAA